MLAGREITVIGAGIGGLATALALRQRGAEPRVLERADRITEVGAGLQISPNGVAVLDALGLGGPARASATAMHAVRLLDGPTARMVVSLDLARDLPGRSFLLFHRADLISLLHAAALDAGVRVETGRVLSDITEAAGRARLVLADGTTETVPLAIGAEGLRSRTRAALNGAAEPFFTGQVAWRALIGGDAGPPEATVHMGPGRHLVTYPLRGGRLRNLVGVEERTGWAEEGWQHRDDPDRFRAAFRGFAQPVRALLDQLDEVHLWGLFRHPVARYWHSAALALVGDAAHPTLPFLAQGANLALEDAWTLADCLDRFPQEAALAAYQARRRDRALRVIAAANANARNYHLSGPARALAHTALRLGARLAPRAPLGRFAWLWDHDVTRG